MIGVDLLLSHATTVKDAELVELRSTIEALRAEVEEARRIAIEHADARSFADDRANMAEARAERLEEALRYAEAFISVAVPQLARDRDEATNEVLPTIRAALRDHDKEARNG